MSALEKLTTSLYFKAKMRGRPNICTVTFYTKHHSIFTNNQE